MYSPLWLALKYTAYWLTARNGHGHGIHSPFVYDLIRNVLMDQSQYPAYREVEQYRKRLLNDHRTIAVHDLGAGSERHARHFRRISEIARSSAKSPRFGKLLYRLASYYGYTHILELGTSLGLTSSYLGRVPELKALVTIEGAPAVADIAREEFNRSGLSKVKLVTGDFDECLGDVLEEMQSTDMVFIDGNHRKEPTLRYFEQVIPHIHDRTLVIFDDVHWSREMEEAWAQICNDQRVKLSVDLFFIGLVFFAPDFREKQHFTIRF